MMTSAVCTAWNDEISNKVDELCLETHENMSGYIVFESGEYNGMVIIALTVWIFRSEKVNTENEPLFSEGILMRTN